MFNHNAIQLLMKSGEFEFFFEFTLKNFLLYFI